MNKCDGCKNYYTVKSNYNGNISERPGCTRGLPVDCYEENKLGQKMNQYYRKFKEDGCLNEVNCAACKWYTGYFCIKMNKKADISCYQPKEEYCYCEKCANYFIMKENYNGYIRNTNGCTKGFPFNNCYQPKNDYGITKEASVTVESNVNIEYEDIIKVSDKKEEVKNILAKYFIAHPGSAAAIISADKIDAIYNGKRKIRHIVMPCIDIAWGTDDTLLLTIYSADTLLSKQLSKSDAKELAAALLEMVAE